MVMCLERELEIEDLRKHPREMVAQLRDALASGAAVTPDPKRISFYEVKHCEHMYYIYVSPNTGKVLLLAAWPQEKTLLAEAAVSA
ncbi:MAG TPA: hypothetical protein VN861_04495 [Candidatus Acidoferrales bacterium]|nr:hypothetical protein [Candidatus Acidoferrales bacterium]